MTDYKELKQQADELHINVLRMRRRVESEDEKALMSFIEHKLSDILFFLNDLQPIEKTKLKYKEGQKVWFMDCTQRDDVITDGVIEKHELLDKQWGEKGYYVTIGELIIPEECVYPTRKALIDAQIDYWTKIKYPEFEGDVQGFNDQSVTECNHSV